MNGQNLTPLTHQVQPEQRLQSPETRLRHRRAFSISFSEMPLARAHVSTAASPCSATAFLTAQQGKA
jgi:hypothetical protein